MNMEKYNEFTKQVDELILTCNDPDFVNGLRILDSEGLKRGLDIYDMVYEATLKNMAANRASNWLSKI